MERILVPVDGSKPSERAVRHVIRLSVAGMARRCNRLLTTPQSPIRGDDGRHTRDYACRILSAQRNRARRSAQRVHRVQPRGRALP
jgi:hypothetical protein